MTAFPPPLSHREWLMPPRFLFGPVEPDWLHDHLPKACREDRSLPFGPGEDWPTVARRLPPGWEPDFVALLPAYRYLSPTFWRAPIPRVALAQDWNLLWHEYRRVLP